MLTAYTGNSVNRELLFKAFEKPSLIIDCGNCANPHIKEEQLHDVYVMNAEAIYRLRDALNQADHWLNKLKLKSIIVTTLHTLFSYDDETENYNVIEHCWQIMKRLSEKYPVFVGATEYEKFAVKYADKIERK
jgi:hypothetical protein